MNVEGMPNINASVDALLSAIDNTIPLVQEFLKDTSFSLEDRWALYLKVEDLLPRNSYGSDAVYILSDALYDDFYLERYQVVKNSEIVERICENRTPDGHDPDEYTEKWDAFYAKLNEYKEAVLIEGHGGFTNDW